MGTKILNILSWNVNSLRPRITDLHAYLMLYDVDIIALQETGTEDDSLLTIRKYQGYYLPADRRGNTRGLLTYVRKDIPAEMVFCGVRNGTETLIVKAHTQGNALHIVNMYVHPQKFDSDDMPDCLFNDTCLLVGDINARHERLGTMGASNANGRGWIHFLEELDNINILGDAEPTHLRGGRLDYAILFNMCGIIANANVVGDLVSDHFALSVSIHIDKAQRTSKRQRYNLPDNKKQLLVDTVQNWYAEYKYADIDNFFKDLLQTIYPVLTRHSHKSESNRKRQNYARDKIVQGWNKLLRKVHRDWSVDHNNPKIRAALVETGKICTEIRQEARSRYWTDFLWKIGKTKNLGSIWKEVNNVRGIHSKSSSVPNAYAKANRLILRWSRGESINELPLDVQASLREGSKFRNEIVQCQIALQRDTCVPITQAELNHALKHRKFTAPGNDGITYDIVNCLASIKNGPVLDLFNMSYNAGYLPLEWKKAVIMPIPKQNGDYRPISMTSCFCKTMERVILNRLLYKIEGLLSPNLYGFIKGRSTMDCIMNCLNNSNATCRAFIDIKGAFDRANKEVILEELVNLGVTGKLLKWIQSYLSNRKARVWLQGSFSEEKVLELGTPQGGVLSPTLFNVLMNVIARHEFPRGTQIIIYTDDMLLQSETIISLQEALNDLGALCCKMGLVICNEKTKIQTQNNMQVDLLLNETKLQKVDVYKYLGIYIGYTSHSKVREISYLENACKGRLRPLKVLAWRGNGAGIPVLRAVYISTVRSVIDYAASALILYSKKHLQKLERIQNEAMRIILGCQRNTRTDIMRTELNLPSIECRIKELTIAAVLRNIWRNPNSALSNAMQCLNEGKLNVAKYARTLYFIMLEYGVLAYCTTLRVMTKFKPWQDNCVALDILQLGRKKDDWHPEYLKQVFLEKINELPKINSVHMYCDGSVLNDGRAGCGIYLREYFCDGSYINHTISRRLGDNISSTRAELHAINEGLQYFKMKIKDVYVLVDSRSSLEALQSRRYDNDIISACKQVIIEIQEKNFQVRFIWIPSHVGIHFNEVADDLAKRAAKQPNIDTEGFISMKMIKSEMRRKREGWDIRKMNENAVHSESLQHYLYVLENSNVTYGKNLSYVDTVMMRIRLGYKYFWQVKGGEGQCCQLCKMNNAHTLHHYILECECIQTYRNDMLMTVKEQVCWLINNNVIRDILKRFKNFAPRL